MSARPFQSTNRCLAQTMAMTAMNKALLLFVALSVAVWWFKDPVVDVPDSDVSFGYIVRYSGDAGRRERLPMLVALHGNGDTAKNFYETALDQLHRPARILLIKGPLSYRMGDAWPWDSAGFSQYGEALNAAVEQLVSRFPTQGKPLLMGFSGGAMMAYYQALKHGDSYSYIFPVSGHLPAGISADEATGMAAKVIAFHGNRDQVIGFGGGKAAVEQLRKTGVEVEFEAFDGGHKALFTEMKPLITRVIEEKMQKQ